MMRGGSRVIASVIDTVGGSGATLFFIPPHASLYEAICDAWKANEHPEDLQLFTGWLKKRRKLTEIGGAADLTSIYALDFPAAGIGEYITKLRELSYLRRSYQVGKEIAQLATSGCDDAEAVVKHAQHALLDLTTDGTRATRTIEEIVHDVIERMSKPDALGIPTGFKQLDSVVGGLAESAKIVIGGPISGGKSAFVQTLANALAVERNVPMAIFTYEMADWQTVQRIIQIRSRVSTRRILLGEATLEEQSRWTQAAGEVARAPLYVISDRLDVAGIRARCLQLKSSKKLRVAALDYLQIIPESLHRGENETNRLDRMSRETKQIAHQLGITLIELVQLTEKDGKFDPRGSKGIRADGDQFWTLHGGEEDDESPIIQKELHIAKQRDGARRKIQFEFKREITRFREKKN
jgi:replicative DNA helicase